MASTRRTPTTASATSCRTAAFNSQYTAKNQMFGYDYDAADNLLSDGINLMTWDGAAGCPIHDTQLVMGGWTNEPCPLPTTGYYVPMPTQSAVDLGGTVIQAGDKFAWSQYAVPSTAAGFGLNFTDGTFAAGLPLVDQDGNPTTADGVTGRWHDRVVDLSSQAGKTISFTYFMTDGETAAGDWSVDYRDITFLRADGTGSRP